MKLDQTFCSVGGIHDVCFGNRRREPTDFFGVGLHTGGKARNFGRESRKIFHAHDVLEQTAFTRQRTFQSDQCLCSICGIVNVRLCNRGTEPADFSSVGLHAGCKSRHPTGKGSQILNADQILQQSAFARQRIFKPDQCLCGIRGIIDVRLRHSG